MCGVIAVSVLLIVKAVTEGNLLLVNAIEGICHWWWMFSFANAVGGEYLCEDVSCWRCVMSELHASDSQRCQRQSFACDCCCRWMLLKWNAAPGECYPTWWLLITNAIEDEFCWWWILSMIIFCLSWILYKMNGVQGECCWLCMCYCRWMLLLVMNTIQGQCSLRWVPLKVSAAGGESNWRWVLSMNADGVEGTW